MKPLIFIGDIHGNFNFLTWKIKSSKLNDSIIVQVGDFGIGFTTRKNDINLLENLNSELSKYNCFLYAIRGNHDDPYYFDGSIKMSNLYLVPDYEVIPIDTGEVVYNTLFVGGAISIDRNSRMEEMQYLRLYHNDNRNLWWSGEIFNFKKEKVENLNNIDIVVTHTAPDFCYPFNKGDIVLHYEKQDKDLKLDLAVERSRMTEMFNILKRNNKIKYHFYGHFHSYSNQVIEDVNHILLDIGGLYSI